MLWSTDTSPQFEPWFVLFCWIFWCRFICCCPGNNSSNRINSKNRTISSKYFVLLFPLLKSSSFFNHPEPSHRILQLISCPIYISVWVIISSFFFGVAYSYHSYSQKNISLLFLWVVFIVAGVIFHSETHFTRLLLTQYSSLDSIARPISLTDFVNPILICQIFPGIGSSTTTKILQLLWHFGKSIGNLLQDLSQEVCVQGNFHLRLEAYPRNYIVSLFFNFVWLLDTLCVGYKYPLLEIIQFILHPLILLFGCINIIVERVCIYKKSAIGLWDSVDID